MRTIWKFQLETTDTQTVNMPAGSQVLSVGMQGATITLWALCDPDVKASPVTIEIRGTGHLVVNAHELSFIGTVFDGPFVWHVFERRA